MNRLRGWRKAALAGGVLAATAAGAPAGAIERIELRLPLLDITFTAKVDELRDTRRLLSGNSDLAELDQATNGMIGRRVVEVFQAPLPLQVRSFANQAVEIGRAHV
jgi:hypothetical protein